MEKAKPRVTIYTDGGSHGNPGPGGFGAILLQGKFRKQIAGGFRLTTNNRMEILGVIKGLEALNQPCSVTIVSDSQYVVNAINKGWAKKWQANGWMRNKRDHAENSDLWKRLLALCTRHDVEFTWVRGHDGNTENENADRLAVAASHLDNLPPDEVYEQNIAKNSEFPLL